MTKATLIIKADCNDADYIHRIEVFDLNNPLDKDWFEAVKAAVIKFKNVAKIHHNWCTSEYSERNEDPYIMYKDFLTEEEISIIDEVTPYGEYGIHTIESVNIFYGETETLYGGGL